MANETSFGELLIESLEEAVAFERGDLEGATVRRVEITARNAQVPPPPHFAPDRIVSIRKRLKVSQPVFASMLYVSSGTVKAWEQGVREPTGATRRLLEVVERNPEVVTHSVTSFGKGKISSGARVARDKVGREGIAKRKGEKAALARAANKNPAKPRQPR